MNTILQHINIAHIASVVPEKSIELDSLDTIYGENEVKKIIKTTGIHRVRYVDENTTSADLCKKAANIILNKKPLIYFAINKILKNKLKYACLSSDDKKIIKIDTFIPVNILIKKLFKRQFYS